MDDFGVDDVLGGKIFKEAAGGEAVVIGLAEAQDDEFEGVEEFAEVREVVDGGGGFGGEGGIEVAEESGVDGAFEVNVEFGEGRRKGTCHNVKDASW